MTNFSPMTSAAITAARSAGALLAEGYGTSFAISSKEGKHNLVTEYDTKAERLIIDALSSAFPDSAFLAEESGQSGTEDNDMLWIVDPLDGTVNFAHSIPIFSVSIAAMTHGALHCGVVYHPLLDELFVAERGKGAFLNDAPIRVSSVASLSDAMLVTGFPYNVALNPNNCIDDMAHMLQMGMPIRRLGSAALDFAYVAAGRFDGYWEASLGAWDAAAGLLLVREAGGSATQFDGAAIDLFGGTYLVTNGRIHDELSQTLARHH